MIIGEGRDPYSVLGVGRHASEREISRAYRRAARLSHPDNGDGGSAAGFRSVNDAYAVLRDPVRRAAYDTAYPASDPPVVEARNESAHYALPGSQHLIIGRRESVNRAREESPLGRMARVEYSIWLWP